MDAVSSMRAEMCAHQEHGVSDQHDECLEFMTTACNPGPDMLMNGTPGEISTGHGWCTQFFAKHAGANGIAASPAGAPGAPGAAVPAAVPPALASNNGDVYAENDLDYPAEEQRQVMAANDMEATMDEVGELMRVRSQTQDERKEELAALYWYEDELTQKLEGLDEDEYCRRVQQEASLVGQETSAPGMSEMLAEIRCDMQRYSLPFYRKVVEDNIEMVRQEQKRLMGEIESGKKHNRTITLEDDEGKADVESKVDVEEKTAPAAPREEPSEGWSWWDVAVALIVVACIVGACFAARKTE